MKFNKWTVALAAIGVVSLASAARADEQPMQMNAVHTALSSTTLSGYVDTAATWRPGTDQNNNGGPNIPAYAFAKNDGFSLNAVDLALDKPLDESPWAAGYHVEMMFGPDAVPGVSGINSVSQFTSDNIRQAYISLRTPVGNGIDWKVGVWDTIVGYESSSAPLDPNYTRSYGYTIEPTTHTGILGTYKINDMVTVQAGIADGSNVAGGPYGINGTSSIESQKAYMGDIQLTAPESAGFMNGATVTVGVIDAAGNNTTFGGGNYPGTTSFYVGGTVPTPNSALKLGACFDYLDVHNNGYAGNHANDSVYNIALYSSYQATEKLALNLRFEYLNATQLGNLPGGGSLVFSNPAYDGHGAEELTATAQYQMWANVISRLEFRWDHVEGSTDAFGANSQGNPYKSNDFLLALNLIYQF